MSTLRSVFYRVFELPALLVLPVIAITLGTIGFENTRDTSNIQDSLYRSIQMLGLNFEIENDWVADGDGISLILTVARWIAAIATFTVVVELVSRNVGVWLRLLGQSMFPEDRIILLGFGDINHAVAQAVKARHVTAIDKSFDEADRRMA